MNYRHAFHAGNFADLVKHAALIELLARMDGDPAPLTVIDTHAGAGLYDLTGAESRRSAEAQAGVDILMAAGAPPPELEALRAAVTAASGAAGGRNYPGSPWLIARALRAQDRLVACELRPEEHAALTRVLAGRSNAEALCVDGFGAAVEACPRRGRVLAVIDPPFERPDDYRRIVETAGRLLSRNPQAAVMVWTPLKDLETLDSFQRGLRSAIRDPLLSLEARMRPLDDPMRLNGCGLSLIGAPAGMDASLQAIGGWVTRALGDAGEARVYLSA